MRRGATENCWTRSGDDCRDEMYREEGSERCDTAWRCISRPACHQHMHAHAATRCMNETHPTCGKSLGRGERSRSCPAGALHLAEAGSDRRRQTTIAPTTKMTVNNRSMIAHDGATRRATGGESVQRRTQRRRSVQSPRPTFDGQSRDLVGELVVSRSPPLRRRANDPAQIGLVVGRDSSRSRHDRRSKAIAVSRRDKSVH